MFKKLLNLNVLGYGLFWSWHVVYLLFVVLGFTPLVAVELWHGVNEGWVPWQFLLQAIILYVVPAVGIVLGLTRLRKQPRRLLLLGYGVEAPILLLTLVRFFAVREVTPFLWLLLLGMAVGWVILLWYVLVQPAQLAARWLAVRQIGLLVFAPLCAYIAIFVAFFAVPMPFLVVRALFEAIKSLFQERWWTIFGVMPNMLIGGVFMGYTATLLAGLPLALPTIAWRAWRWQWQALPAKARQVVLGVGGGLTLLWCVALGWTAQQPQPTAWAALSQSPTTLAEAQALAKQERALRAALLNSYLARFRYAGVQARDTGVQTLYAFAFGSSSPDDDVTYAWVQQAFNAWVAPFLYQPQQQVAATDWRTDDFTADSDNAAALYQRFFDQPINQAERDAIVLAARTTWETQQARSAWQAVDEREVHLETQAVQVTEHGDWASVELAESYRNVTTTREEVVYYFSLPESAVLTGLWLGNSPDRAARFEYVVAPRGAAQQVYQEQVQVQRDPALLEQLGPRQYRLRVFPIEPPTFTWGEGGYRSTETEAPLLYLWLTYDVLLQDGGWAMPLLAEKRNLFWDTHSVRTVNGAAFYGADWLPKRVPAHSPGVLQPKRVDFPNGQTVLALPANRAADLSALAAAKIAVVIDRSGSMAAQSMVLQAVLTRLAEESQHGLQWDAYLSAAAVRGEPASWVAGAQLPPVSQWFFFGGQHPAELLAQFAALRGERAYDAVLVLTDAGGYELGESPLAIPDLGAQPVWFVHLGGLPLGYDDATLAAIQTSGGSATDSVDDALAQIALQLAQPSRFEMLADGYYWQVLPTVAVDTTLTTLPATDAFVPLAARRLLLATFAQQAGTPPTLETLDALHQIAVRYHVVSPYSSMLVLVNEQQQQRLEQLSQQADRFEREVEQVGETLPSVTGVPEPHEWLLLGLAALGLLWYARQRRRMPAVV